MKYYVEVKPSGTFWYRDAEFTIHHREDGPAFVGAKGSNAWWLNGKRHREDGPAYIGADGSKEWWLDGEKYTEADFNLLQYYDK